MLTIDIPFSSYNRKGKYYLVQFTARNVVIPLACKHITFVNGCVRIPKWLYELKRAHIDAARVRYLYGR